MSGALMPSLGNEECAGRETSMTGDSSSEWCHVPKPSYLVRLRNLFERACMHPEPAHEKS